MPKTKGRAEQSGPNKSQSIRDYLASHPDDGPAAVVAALKAKGIAVSPGLVGLVKFQARKAGGNRPGRPAGRRGPSRSRTSRGANAAGNKSYAVRTYLADNPDAGPNTVKEALAKQGIKISASLVSAIKYRKPAGRAGRKRGPKPGRPSMAAASMNGVLDVDALIEAKRFADRIGGLDVALSALKTLQQLA